MVRVTLHNVLDTAWLEVQRHTELHGTWTWVSIGRRTVGDLDDVRSVLDALDLLVIGVGTLGSELKDKWRQMDVESV